MPARRILIETTSRRAALAALLGALWAGCDVDQPDPRLRDTDVPAAGASAGNDGLVEGGAKTGGGSATQGGPTEDGGEAASHAGRASSSPGESGSGSEGGSGASANAGNAGNEPNDSCVLGTSRLGACTLGDKL